jgi:hypothetical protein
LEERLYAIGIVIDLLEDRVSRLQIATPPGTQQDIPTITDDFLNFLIQDITRSVLAQLSAPSFVYVPVGATAGQVIIGAEGTEIILRSGEAIIFSEVADGLVNVTTGTEVFHNDIVAHNNLLIVPRGDNRGVFITSDSAWFIIRGEYWIR